MSIQINGHELKIQDIVEVSRNATRVEIDTHAIEKMKRSRKFVDDLVERGEVVYGVTTGFGQFKNKVIDPAQAERLQLNLIRSHATGVGDPLSQEVVRASLLVRANSLVHGYSGIRPVVVQRILDLLNMDIYPYVPSKGSVGSSGDLAPLSHMILVLLGEGEVIVDGRRVPAAPVLEAKGFRPITLKSKEGLALNNGTSVQTGIAALAVYDAHRLARLFDISLAMSVEAMMGSLSPFQERVHVLRPHPGQIQSASNIRMLCSESEIIKSHKNCDRVQDSYSLRCAAQVHGASRSAIDHVHEVVQREINSVTDNPLIFAIDGDAVSAGHFHGEPIAQAMDYLKIAICELANISERRIAKITDSAYSEGLPAFLIPEAEAGLSSGYMIPQYVAAALVSENKVLAHPASVDSIPTSANQEDHVSMGTIAARQVHEIIQNAKSVVAIEMMCGAQGLDFRSPLTPGIGVDAAYKEIRRYASRLETDRVLYVDIDNIQEHLGDIYRAVVNRLGSHLE